MKVLAARLVDGLRAKKGGRIGGGDSQHEDSGENEERGMEEKLGLIMDADMEAEVESGSR